MADIKLSSGREIDFDLDKLTLEEYRKLFSKTTPVEYEDELIARVANIEFADLQKLTLKDYKRLAQRFYKKVREPLADPS